MKETLGDYIRKFRKSKGLPIRKLASKLDIDQSTLSKIERGERLPTKKSIPRLASVLNLKEEEILTSYLGDKVLYPILEEENPEEVLKAAEEKLKYIRSKKSSQGEIEFK